MSFDTKLSIYKRIIAYKNKNRLEALNLYIGESVSRNKVILKNEI